MTYQALARRWRPQSFEDLTGQIHVAKALSYALTEGRLHHAYLFTGTRGVGKTTIARILAKCLNCDKGVSHKPCGTCPSCLDIESGRYVDLLEIDAASKTKVEDTRELLENVLYAPTRGSCKIYLIDEVHMLSGHSFNALLKTLEEPPPHVKFLLATTDPQKLPITVLSRCLHFHLKQLTLEQITERLSSILAQEKIMFDPNALPLIAQAAQGSMRDALSLLDQAIASGNGRVETAEVTHMLGMQGQHYTVPLLKAIMQQDIAAALEISRQLNTLAADFQWLLEQLITLIHTVSLKQGVPNAVNWSTLWPEEAVLELSTLSDASDLQLYYQIALHARRDLNLAPSPQIGFEMGILRMIAFRVVEDAEKNLPIQKEQSLPSAAQKPIVSNGAAPIKKTASRETQSVESPVQPSTPILSEPEKITPVVTTPTRWSELLPLLNLTAFSKALAEHLHFERTNGDHFYFCLDEKNAPMLQERYRQRIVTALSEYLNRPIAITIQVGRSLHSQHSVVEQKTQAQEEKVKNALKGFSEDSALQKVLTQFNATIIPDTLELVSFSTDNV